jgi:hypothetical protein
MAQGGTEAALFADQINFKNNEELNTRFRQGIQESSAPSLEEAKARACDDDGAEEEDIDAVRYPAHNFDY